jgi:hypothetical protein
VYGKQHEGYLCTQKTQKQNKQKKGEQFSLFLYFFFLLFFLVLHSGAEKNHETQNKMLEMIYTQQLTIQNLEHSLASLHDKFAALAKHLKIEQ